VRDHLGERLCPYHTLQGLIPVAHVVVCDYWWLFSQKAAAGDLDARLGAGRQWAVVVDEAHNLPLRVRAELDVEETSERLESALGMAPAVVRACLEPVIEHLLAEGVEGVAPSTLLPLAGGEKKVRAAFTALAEDDSEACLLDRGDTDRRALGRA